jgi:hypothetical protein
MTPNQKDKQTQQGLRKKVTVLENSIYYFLECVFIIIEDDRYRLVVAHQKQLLLNCVYNTLRGAKIAFSRMYLAKAWREDIKAEWTHPYPPELKWLKQKLPTEFNYLG